MPKSMIDLQDNGKQVTTLADTDLFLAATDPSGTPDDAVIEWGDALLELLKRTTYQISRSVASNNLTVAVKNSSGNDASTDTPLRVVIDGNIRTLTGALSVTVNAAANTFNAGGAELATKEIDYFVYLGWRASNTSVFVLISRIPYATTYADFSGTATNEKYGAYSGTAPTSTDKVRVIGRFNATLSAGAGYTWSVPATSVVINRPIYETRELSWQPAYSGSGSMTYTSVTTTQAKYKIIMSQCQITALKFTGTTGGTGNTYLRATAPFDCVYSADNVGAGANLGIDGAVGTFCAMIFVSAGTPNLILCPRYDFAAYGLGASRIVQATANYKI